jgi:hypothetical protein
MTAGISKRIGGGLLAIIFVVLNIGVANSQEIEYVGSCFLGGEFMGLHVNQPYAICGMYAGFQILDISDPEAIYRVGDNPFVGRVREFVVSGAFAYATTFEQDFGSFLIVDIQNVEEPTITGFVDSVGNGEMAISDDYAYVLNYDEPVGIIDISNPYSPEIAGSYENNDNNFDIFISGTYAYLASRDVGLRVLDISSPLEPAVIAQYSSPVSDYAGQVFASGNYAYTVSYTSDYNAMIEIVGISNPHSPAYVGHLGVWNVGHLFVEGDYIYAFQEWFFDEALFIIVNAEDPTSPYLESSTEFGSILDPLNVFVVECKAYISRDQTLMILDVSDPSAPIETASFESANGLSRIVLSGDHVYGIYEPLNSGFYVFDVSNPASPDFITRYGVGDDTGDLTVVGDYAYVAEHGFQILDVSTPESPSFVGDYETGTVRSIKTQGRYAYLTVWASEMQIVDIRDPADPVFVGNCPVEWPWGICVQDDKAFIARYQDNQGLAIVDISDPYQPVFMGGCEAPGTVHKWVTVQGHYAYMTVGYYGVQIIDVGDPHNPEPVAYCETPGRVDDIYVAGDYAYVADAQNGLFVFDVSDPANPAFVASFDTPGWASGCYVDGQYVYVADDYSLMVLGVSGGDCVYVPGDCDHNGTPLELSDVSAMIAYYRGTMPDPYTCSCPPQGDYFMATADPEGNCLANELSDIVMEIAAYRGLAEASGCPDCPGSRR